MSAEISGKLLRTKHSNTVISYAARAHVPTSSYIDNVYTIYGSYYGVSLCREMHEAAVETSGAEQGT